MSDVSWRTVFKWTAIVLAYLLLIRVADVFIAAGSGWRPPAPMPGKAWQTEVGLLMYRVVTGFAFVLADRRLCRGR